MASCTKCEKSKLNQTTEHAEQIHRDSIEFVKKPKMQVFRFSVFSSARLRGTTIPNQWRNLVRDGEVGEVGRDYWDVSHTRSRPDLERLDGVSVCQICQCHKSHWSHRSVLRKGSAASILFDKVRFGKALKAQNLFGSVFASTLSLRRHHVDMWVDTISWGIVVSCEFGLEVPTACSVFDAEARMSCVVYAILECLRTYIVNFYGLSDLPNRSKQVLPFTISRSSQFSYGFIHDDSKTLN